MSRATVILYAAVFLILGALALNAQTQIPQTSSQPASSETYPPSPAKYFNDYAGITSTDTRQRLNEKLADFDKQTTNQFVVAIFQHFTSSTPFADYCTAVFNQWKVGQKGKNNGVVLFIFMADHKLRITTGRGMETILPDKDCKKIIDDVIVPAFRKGDYDAGLTSAVTAIINAIVSKQPSASRSISD